MPNAWVGGYKINEAQSLPSSLLQRNRGDRELKRQL